MTKPINTGDVIEVPPPPPLASDVEISDAVIIEQPPLKTTTNEQYQDEDFVMYPDKKPQYPGGEVALFKFVGANLQYPQAAREAKIQGIVVVTFDIEKGGSITKIRTTKGIGGECDQEAERVVKLLPNWIPAEHNGKKVRIFFDLPVRLEL